MRLLATELSKLKTSGGGDGNLGVGPKANNGRGSHWMIDEWKLTKVENEKEFGEIHHPENTSDKRTY